MDKKSCKSCKVCPSRWRNFDNLTDEQMDRINEKRFEARFKSGEVIFKQGSPTSNAIFIISGMAKIYTETENGKSVRYAIAKPGRLITGPGTFVDNIHHYSLATIKDTVACFVDIGIIKELILENGRFAQGFIEDISAKALNSFDKILSISQKKMNGRLAEGILHLSDEIFQSDEFNCCLTRQELGELTLMTKESVVRLLKEFDEEGIVKVKGSNLKIMDKNRLTKIMQSG
ncbi:MAG: hypothetical protein C0599_14450 [Salinivirgaceae bacterium]|nr:MAG: hypothetical protein C0599_14450 [Salinivirgaceae bacterium]